jgi:fumarate reductase subunit C
MNEIIKKNGVTYGTYAATIFVSILVLMYLIDLSLFTKWYIGVFQFLAIIVLGVLVVKKSKADLNNFISFKDAFTAFFIMILVGLSAYTLTSILLFNVIDPEAKKIITEHFMQYTKEMMEGFNLPASEIKKALAEMKKQDNFSISKQSIGFIFSLLFYSVIGLIIATIFKSKSQDAY